MPDFIKEFIKELNQDDKNKDDQVFRLDFGEVSFKMTEFSDTGKLKVKFSHTMRKITELSTIDSSVLKLKLYPDETSTHKNK